MRSLLCFLILLYVPACCFSQFGYTYSVKSAPYQPLTNAISINADTLWDEEMYKLPIGFSFILDGKKTDSFAMLGPTYIASDSSGDVTGFWSIDADLYDRGQHTTGVSASPLRYSVTGNAGNRICKIEIANAAFWNEYYFYHTTDDYINLQIWLCEAGNAVEFHYGASHVTYPGDYFLFSGKPQAGLFRFSTDSAFINAAYYLYGDPQHPGLDSAFHVDELPDGLDPIPAEGTVYRFEPLPTAVSDMAQHAVPVRVYPTVCTGQLTIDNSGAGPIQYQILSIDGREHITNGIAAATGRSMIDVSALTKGLYIIQLQNKDVHQAVKFIKQ